MISLDDAIIHLRVDSAAEDEVRHKFAEAVALVHRYLGTDPSTVVYDLVSPTTTHRRPMPPARLRPHPGRTAASTPPFSSSLANSGRIVNRARQTR
jgi:hypothetical protein